MANLNIYCIKRLLFAEFLSYFLEKREEIQQNYTLTNNRIISLSKSSFKTKELLDFFLYYVQNMFRFLHTMAIALFVLCICLNFMMFILYFLFISPSFPSPQGLESKQRFNASITYRRARESFD